jgi:hypothetical protein
VAFRPAYPGPRRTRAQLRLPGREPDDVVAAEVGRSVGAVRSKRTTPGIPTARDRRRKA